MNHPTIPRCDHTSAIDDHVTAENSKFFKKLSLVQENMNLLMRVMRIEVSEHERKMSKLLGLKNDQGKGEVKKVSICERVNKISGRPRLNVLQRMNSQTMSVDQALNGRTQRGSLIQPKLLPPKPWENNERLNFQSNYQKYNTDPYHKNANDALSYFPAPMPNYNTGHAPIQQFNQRQFGYVHPQDPEEFTHQTGSNFYGQHQEAFNQWYPPVYKREVIKHGVWQEANQSQTEKWNEKILKVSRYALQRQSPAEPSSPFLPANHKQRLLRKSQNQKDLRRSPNPCKPQRKKKYEKFHSTPSSREKTSNVSLKREEKRSHFISKNQLFRRNKQSQAAPRNQIARKQNFHPTVVHRQISRKPPPASHSSTKFAKLRRNLKPVGKNFGSSSSNCSSKQNSRCSEDAGREHLNKSTHRTVVVKKHIKGLRLGPHNPEIAVIREVTKQKKKPKKMRRAK